MAAPKRDPGSVFLNVPFDRAYEPFFVTLVSALISLGQTPRCVLEVRERGQGRLARIYELLRSCGVSLHDLSRAGQPVRFNMPFELGLACSIALAGEAHDIAVLDAVPYRLDRTLSDYKGRDPLIYHHQLNGIVDCIADLFRSRTSPLPPSSRPRPASSGVRPVRLRSNTAEPSFGQRPSGRSLPRRPIEPGPKD